LRSGRRGLASRCIRKRSGRTFGAPTFALDLGATKGSLVGQSEERIRGAMKVIRAVSGDGAFFVATCNKLDALPPELRRRFRYGLWFFDLPTVDERAPIWMINMRKFEIRRSS
jgi:AAA+ superfamily predicted ATPase